MTTHESTYPLIKKKTKKKKNKWNDQKKKKNKVQTTCRKIKTATSWKLTPTLNRVLYVHGSLGTVLIHLRGQAKVRGRLCCCLISDSILRFFYFYPTLTCWCNSLNKKAQKELYERRQQIGDEDFFFLYFLSSTTIQWVREFSLYTTEMVESPSQGV